MASAAANSRGHAGLSVRLRWIAMPPTAITCGRAACGRSSGQRSAAGASPLGGLRDGSLLRVLYAAAEAHPRAAWPPPSFHAPPEGSDGSPSRVLRLRRPDIDNGVPSGHG